MNVQGKTAVVTGASRGLGHALSEALVKKGVRVFGVARNRTLLESIQASLGSLFVPVQLDITKADFVESWIHNSFSDSNCPDILINNAGIGAFKKVDETDTELWANMMNTNLNGVFYVTSGLVRLMKRKNSPSHIVNIGSVLGTVGKAEATAYSASKFGIRGFSESLYMELRHHGIKVTCVCPGSIETSFFQDSGISASPSMLQPADVANTIVHILETPDTMLINEIILRPLTTKRSN